MYARGKPVPTSAFSATYVSCERHTALFSLVSPLAAEETKGSIWTSLV
jgi:hypothetical protein